MMYNSKFVCCVKANGKVLREFNDTVRVPFGTEFSILLKNLNTVRAQVQISIDGEMVTGNSKIIVNPNEDFELTRYIKNGNLTSGNRFKFIERTASIEEYRGVKLDDGLIRVTFQFERVIPQTIQCSNPSWNPNQPYWLHQPRNVSYGVNVNNTSIGGSDVKMSKSGSNILNRTRSAVAGSSEAYASATMDFMEQSQVSDAGITVPGSISEQQFRNVDNFPVEFETHVIVLKIAGIIDNGQAIIQPVTVKTQNKCQTCGTVNKYKAKFCSECATALVVV